MTSLINQIASSKYYEETAEMIIETLRDNVWTGETLRRIDKCDHPRQIWRGTRWVCKECGMEVE